MSILKDVFAELLGMFIADVWMSSGIVTVVAVAAYLAHRGNVPMAAVGGLLIAGTLVVLVASVRQGARRLAPRRSAE